MDEMVPTGVYVHHNHGRWSDEDLFLLLFWEYVHDELYVEKEV